MPKIDSGDTAWMITSSALVLMMTIPGLALFYGGMVRKKNVLATLAQSFGATCIITVLWMIIGYSVAFTTNPNSGLNNFIGSFDYFLLGPMGLNQTSMLAPTIPESVYMFFQMTFAIITPALIAGALADRMKFSAFMWFMSLWLLFVYCPIAHRRDGRNGLRRRHGRALERRNRGARHLPRTRQARRLRHREHGAA